MNPRLYALLFVLAALVVVIILISFSFATIHPFQVAFPYNYLLGRLSQSGDSQGVFFIGLHQVMRRYPKGVVRIQLQNMTFQSGEGLSLQGDFTYMIRLNQLTLSSLIQQFGDQYQQFYRNFAFSQISKELSLRSVNQILTDRINLLSRLTFVSAFQEDFVALYLKQIRIPQKYEQSLIQKYISDLNTAQSKKLADFQASQFKANITQIILQRAQVLQAMRQTRQSRANYYTQKWKRLNNFCQLNTAATTLTQAVFSLKNKIDWQSIKRERNSSFFSQF